MPKSSPPFDPHKEYADTYPAWRELSGEIGAALARFSSRASQIGVGSRLSKIGLGTSFKLEGVGNAFFGTTSAIGRIGRELARQGEVAEKLAAEGWLPHHTMPEGEILACADVSETMRHRYEDCWPSVQAAFLDNASSYQLDTEALDVLSDSLEAHGHGLYRVPSRLLFPEIERLSRTYLHGGAIRAITSQQDLRAVCMELTPRALGKHAWYSLHLMPILRDDLYRYVSTEEDLAAARLSKTPNRHAAMHGHIPYADHQSSLNALIMADFTFQVISALRASMEEGLPTSSAAHR